MHTNTRWVKIGKVGDKFAHECETRIKAPGPYHTRRKDGHVCFALRLTPREHHQFIRPSKWMDSSTISQFNSVLLAQYTGMQVPHCALKEATAKSLREEMVQAEGIHRFETICEMMDICPLGQLPDIITKSVAPDFFKWYPNGRIMLVAGAPEFYMALASLRIMGAVIELADRDWEQMKEMGRFEMISNLQPDSDFNPGKHLSIPIALFLPSLHGFAAINVTNVTNVIAGLFFLLDEPIPEVREPFPRSGLEFLRSAASRLLSQSTNIGINEITSEKIDKFRLLDRSFASSDIRTFVRSYITNLNRFASYIVDPSNFCIQGTNEWIGLAHYRAWLSFQRITDEVLFMLTEDAPFLRKMALFRILDQLACFLNDDNREHAGIFKRLLLPDGASDPIGDGLQSYKGEVGKHLGEVLQSARNELREVILGSVYVPGRVDRRKGIVTLPDSTTITADEYVVNVVREVRNTQHGYYTKHFDTYLAASTGDIPDSLPILGALAYLALVAKPELFIGRTWQQTAHPNRN